MTINQETSETLRSQLRRGALVLAVLAQLREEHYGYSLRKSLAQKGLQIEEGTLYPLIRRLEKQSLLVSTWREEKKRRKRFYRLSEEGKRTYQQLLEDWQELDASIQQLTNGSGQ